MTTGTVPALFDGKPGAASAYEELLPVLNGLGAYEIEEKKTCLHACVNGVAFLGIHPRRTGLQLTLVLSRPLEGPRIKKCEKGSAKRFHIDVELKAGDVVDEELKGWLAESYGRKG